MYRSLLFVVLGLSTAAWASPLEFTQQGRIVDATTGPVEGTLPVTFTLYSAPSGGQALWSETLTLSFVDGFYTAILGQVNDIDPADFTDAPRFLGMKIDTNPEFPTRQELTAVPYAFRAESAFSLAGGPVDAESLSVGGELVVDDRANVVGASLSVAGGFALIDEDGQVDAVNYSVNGELVIDDDGVYLGPLDWDQLENVPNGIERDTLASLQVACLPNQVVFWTGTSWACNTPTIPSHTHSATDITGQIGIGQLPVGGGSQAVARGDHEHDTRYYLRSEADGVFYPRTLADLQFYSRTAADAQFYSRVESDVRYYSKTQAEAAFLSQGEGDARYPTITALEAGYYSVAEANAEFLSKSEAAAAYVKRSDAAIDFYTRAQADSAFYPRAEADSTFYSKPAADARFYPRTEADSTFYSRQSADATFLSQAGATATYYPKTQLYTKAEVDAIVDSAVIGGPTTLTQRLAWTSVRSTGAVYGDWRPMSGSGVRFKATGGPVQVTTSIPIHMTGHSGCRTLIDGNTTSLYGPFEATSYWEQGLVHTAPGWRMWNPSRILNGVPKGEHLLSIECHNDSTSGGLNDTSIRHVSVIPYEDPSTSAVKVWSVQRRGSVAFGCCSYQAVPGFSLPFTSQGGPVRVSVSVPMVNGSHSACRPMIDGVPAGQANGDDIFDVWQEGLAYTNPGWFMWNRTRMYTVPAGSHTLTLECRTDSGTVSLADSDKVMEMSVTAYKPASDSAAVAHAYHATSQASQSGNYDPWTAVTGLSVPFTATGGPTEIGVSLSMSGGSTSVCRPLVDGAPITTGEPDNVNDHWHEGLQQTHTGWFLWDRVRMYKNIPAGAHTLTVQCQSDSTTSLSLGTGKSARHAWVVAYDP